MVEVERIDNKAYENVSWWSDCLQEDEEKISLNLWTLVMHKRNQTGQTNDHFSCQKVHHLNVR